MRIVVLDYSGHVPQADLARNLAKFGHSVQHMYCSDYISGRGVVERIDGDSPELNLLQSQLIKSLIDIIFFNVFITKSRFLMHSGEKLKFMILTIQFFQMFHFLQCLVSVRK